MTISCIRRPRAHLSRAPAGDFRAADRPFSLKQPASRSDLETMALRRQLVRTMPLLGAFALAVAPGAGAAKPTPPRLSVVERDFSIRAPHALQSGDVTLVVRNAGPEDHELLVV